ncbi:MAG TPA: TonB-dependent receptor [Thermoanaerobaculia bacterium]|nr:TonB-dependent receptor [Thermoanaerobaculia bacterium]
MNRYAAVILSLLLSSAASAETDAVDKPAGATLLPFADSMTVVGTRIAAAPELIPGAVTVIERQTLESARPLTTSEALRKCPGVTVRDEEGFGLRPNIGLRGTNPARSTKVLLLEDGLPLTYAPYGDNASYYHPPIERFESIEILKGSGQIAFGPVTVGGVLNYLTPMPPSKPSASLLLTAGTRDYFNGHLSFGDTWGKTGLLIDFMRKEGAGARDNIFSELNDFNAKVVHAFSGAQSLTFRANYYGEESNATYSGLRQNEYEADPRQNPFSNDFFYGDRYGASVAHRVRLDDSLLVTTSVYGALFKRHWWRQSSNSNQRPNDSSEPGCGGMDSLLTTCGNEGRLREFRTWGIEPRVQWTSSLFGLPNEIQAGVRALVESQERRQINGDTPQARSGRTVENNARDNVAFAAFVQDRISVGRLSVTPGVRIERIAYERLNRLANGGLGARGETVLTQIVPGIGVSWTTGETTLFGGIHRGFAPPRTEDILTNAGGVVDLDPELSWNSELGVRSSIRPGLSAEATLFRMDYENQVVPASVAGGVGATLTNGGATNHEGIELGGRIDSAALLGTSHNVYTTLAYTHLWEASFAGSRRSNIPGFGHVEVGGHRLPYAPEQTLTAGLGYLMPRGIEAFVEAVHVSDQFGDDLNTVLPTADGQRGLIPPHTIWNATLNVDVAPLRSTLFIAVKNVFDELYIVDRSRGILPGMPRVVQVGMKVRY